MTGVGADDTDEESGTQAGGTVQPDGEHHDTAMRTEGDGSGRESNDELARHAADHGSSKNSDLDELVGEIIDEAQARDPERVRFLIGTAITRHSGPMPPAETLAGYKDVDPDLVTEVKEAARDNRQHRYAMDRSLAATARLSLILTTGVAVLILVIGLVLGLVGQPILSGVFGVGGLGAIILAIIKGGGEWRGKGIDPNP